MPLDVPAAAARAAVSVAAGLGVACAEPVVLADGANVIVHLSPSPVVAKVAASTLAVRPDAAWLRRELDIAGFLVRAGAPVLAPSPEVAAVVHRGDGHMMSFWTYVPPSGAGRPDEAVIGSMLRDLHAVLRSYPVPSRNSPRWQTSRRSWRGRGPRSARATWPCWPRPSAG